MKTRILALIRKELIAVLRDPRTRLSIFLPPLLQLFIFAFAATLDVKNVPIGILNRDNGRQGIELVERFEGAPVFSKIVHLHAVEEMAPFLDRQKGIMILSLDEQFSRQVEAGKGAAVQLVFDGRRSNTAQIVSGYASSIIRQFNAELFVEEYPLASSVQVVPRNWFNPNLIYYWYNIPCIVVILSMLTCLVVTTNSVARERELGTFDQLLVSPITPTEILIGKIVPGIVIGMIEGIGMLAIGVLILKVPFTGSLLLFLLSLFVFVFAISGVGLFLSALAMTQQQAMLGTFTFMMPAVLLSGFATPIETIPAWLQPVSAMIPVRYMLIISKGLFLKAMPARIVLDHIWPMLLIALVTVPGAGLFFRRRIQ